MVETIRTWQSPNLIGLPTRKELVRVATRFYVLSYFQGEVAVADSDPDGNILSGWEVYYSRDEAIAAIKQELGLQA